MLPFFFDVKERNLRIVDCVYKAKPRIYLSVAGANLQ